ncbi:MAG: hypothetical protein R2715_21480 [Ilumatobacteraceae bacterium]
MAARRTKIRALAITLALVGLSVPAAASAEGGPDVAVGGSLDRVGGIAGAVRAGDAARSAPSAGSDDAAAASATAGAALSVGARWRQDTRGDVNYPPADITESVLEFDQTGSRFTASLRTQLFDDPWGYDWAVNYSAAVWDLDVDLDGGADLQIALVNLGDRLAGAVVDGDGNVRCWADASVSPGERRYEVSGPVCFDVGPSIGWGAALYHDFGTIHVLDLAPDTGWYEPILTGALYGVPPTPVSRSIWFADRGFASVTPFRVIDTRSGTGVRAPIAWKVGGDYVLAFSVAGIDDRVPSDGVGAVALNVTATGSLAAGYLTVSPCDARPETSTLNFGAGQTVASAAITPVSAAGPSALVRRRGRHRRPAAWFSSDQVVPSELAERAFLHTVVPTRWFDTRSGSGLAEQGAGRVGPGRTLEVPVSRIGSVGSDATSLSLNVTVTDAEAGGYVTVFPCGTPREVSSVNYAAGQTVANAVITPVSSRGTVCFSASSAVHVIVDANGWMSGDGFTPVDPVRIYDTRSDTGLAPRRGRVEPDAPLQTSVARLGGVVPSGAASALAERHGDRSERRWLPHRLAVRCPRAGVVERQLRGRSDGRQRGDRTPRVHDRGVLCHVERSGRRDRRPQRVVRRHLRSGRTVGLGGFRRARLVSWTGRSEEMPTSQVTNIRWPGMGQRRITWTPIGRSGSVRLHTHDTALRAYLRRRGSAASELDDLVQEVLIVC